MITLHPKFIILEQPYPLPVVLRAKLTVDQDISLVYNSEKLIA